MLGAKREAGGSVSQCERIGSCESGENCKKERSTKRKFKKSAEARREAGGRGAENEVQAVGGREVSCRGAGSASAIFHRE